jgi:hypothetical protein
MKSSLLVVVPASEAVASALSNGHGSECSLRQEEMRRVRLARRALGREMREDRGVVLLLLLVDEEDERRGTVFRLGA